LWLARRRHRGKRNRLVIEGFSNATEAFTSTPSALYAAYFELGIDGGALGSASLGPELATLLFSAAAATVPEVSKTILALIGLITVVVARRISQRRV